VDALLLVDIQRDFLPGGALGVPGGDAVVPVANALMARLPLVAATQDWHPADHASFASQHPGHAVGEVIEINGAEQIMWPDHCVQDTAGAEFADGLKVARIDHVVRKGTERTIDSYSGFFGNDHVTATGLEGYLRGAGVTAVTVVGLATDYCVKFTALDAVALGLRTSLIEDGCRGVELNPGDVSRAIKEMTNAGVRIVAAEQLVKERTVIGVGKSG